MKSHFITGILALTLVLGSVPSLAFAEPLDNAQTATLLERIQILLGQVAGLQALVVGTDESSQNQPPIGYAGNIRNGIANGWTLDPDEPTTKIGFHVYIDGLAGKGGTYVAGGRAGFNRADITKDQESYGHWYEFVIPDEYRDGREHALYVYGIDSKNLKGHNTLLKNNPKSFTISAGSIPSRFSSGDRIKTTTNLNARATPSRTGTIVGAEPKGSLGTIVSGPTNVGGYSWWKIHYDNDTTGWNDDIYLVKVTPTSLPSCTLSASPDSITPDDTSVLSWTTKNATAGTIDNGVGAMTPITAGSKSVSPTDSTSYTATVTGGGDTATCDADVDVTTGTGDTLKPTVSLTAPAASSTVKGTITLKANASDNIGVVGVQFHAAGRKVGSEDTTAPYASTWDSTIVANGTYNLRAVARDAAGNTKTTPVMKVTVNNAGWAPISVGNRVQTTLNLSVRADASTDAARLGVAREGTQGTVRGGPVQVGTQIWWKINYDNNLTGWSVETYLTKGDNVPQPEPALFSPDDRVKITASLAVRESPNGTIITHEAFGSKGTVLNGPVVNGMHTWWKIRYDNGSTGWSAEEWIAFIAPSVKLHMAGHSIHGVMKESNHENAGGQIPSYMVNKEFYMDVDITAENSTAYIPLTAKRTNLTPLSEYCQGCVGGSIFLPEREPGAKSNGFVFSMHYGSGLMTTGETTERVSLLSGGETVGSYAKISAGSTARLRLYVKTPTDTYGVRLRAVNYSGMQSSPKYSIIIPSYSRFYVFGATVRNVSTPDSDPGGGEPGSNIGRDSSNNGGTRDSSDTNSDTNDSGPTTIGDKF